MAKHVHTAGNKRNDGGSAFALPVTISNAGHEHIAYEGMSLRDYFAAKAMQALVAATNTGDRGVCYEPLTVAESAFELADAMLEQREKPHGE